MEHHFNIEEAKKYGIECAVLLYNIRYWIEKNKANGTHFYEGKYWTYNSSKAFSKLFPYLSRTQIARHLRKLEDFGILISGNFNSQNYDKTKWYSIVDEPCTKLNMDSSELNEPCTKLNMDSSELNEGVFKIVQPIPDINTDNKPKLKTQIENKSELEKTFDEYLLMRKAKGKAPTARAIELVKNNLKKLANGSETLAIQILEQSILNSWTDVYPLKSEIGKFASQQDKVKAEMKTAFQQSLDKIWKDE